jgi:thiol-disulfide isomerase/thioredoxin
MRISRSSHSLLILVCVTTGCSQTGGVRPNTASSTRTVASVGDQPFPVVAGESGSSLRASTEGLDLLSSTGVRISGRVFDENGKPVSNAKVRLAVGSSPGGKINYAMTEQSGGFTLRGLRANSTYTIIAEYQGEDGVMTGRVEAEAPGANVRINLQPRDANAGQNRSAIRPAKPRVEPISNSDSGDDDEALGSGKTRNKNDDTEPPDEDAASLPRNSTLRTARASSGSSTSAVRAGWNVSQQSAQNDERTASQSRTWSDRTESTATSQGKVSKDVAAEVDDDGPNPLPPAIEDDQASSARRSDVDDDRPIKMARGASRSPSRSSRTRVADTIDPADSKVNDPADRTTDQEPRPIPEDILPRRRVNAPESFEPTIVVDRAGTDDAPVQSSKRTQRTTPKSSTRSRSPNSSSDRDSTKAADSPDPNSSTEPRPRPTWREISFNRADVPLDESVRLAAGDASSNDKRVITLTSATEPAKSRLPRLLTRARPPLDPAVTQTLCQIDPTEGRLVDFQLPGLDGKMVSLHDIDADLILLDFWGSWCKQCRESSPHLGELQAKFAGKRLQVVGIACEKGASIQERLASAAKGVQDLGIKYPVLVTSMDGSCPVQKGLQVKFYPTMLLLDRSGRLLEREQGATEVTLARIDRAVDSAVQERTGRLEDEGVVR